jgi:hypothetical protein
LAAPSPKHAKRTGGPRTADGKAAVRFNGADSGAWSEAFTEVRRYLRSIKHLLKAIKA